MNDEFMYCPRCGAMAHIPKLPEPGWVREDTYSDAVRAEKPVYSNDDPAYRGDTDATD